MTPALPLLDIVLDALERGETPSVVILPDPRDASRHPGLPGTDWRYGRGCRCGACRAAHAASNLRSRMTAAERAASS